MESFTCDELESVSQVLEKSDPFDEPDAQTHEGLRAIAAALLDSLHATESEDDALEVTAFFLSKAVQAGMLITGRRQVVSDMLFYSKTLGMDC